MILKKIKFARKKAFFSGIWVVFFTTLSFLGFFTRDYLLAKTIGINSSLDLFYLVTVLPMFFVNIFCIPFGNALVPKLIKIIKLGKPNSNVLIRHLSFLSFTFCLILCLFTYFFSSNFFSLFHYLGWIKFENTSNLMILLYTPILLLSGLVILVNSILIARGHYIFPSVAQIAVPILSILSLLIFGLHWGVYSVIIGMVVGQITNFILGIRIIVYGEKPVTQGLIVANHRSYLDPIAIVSQVHAFTVGKKEVESWPLIGYICKVSGVLFVDRKCEKSRQDTAENIREVLGNGFSIINFPEGTTDILPTTVNFNYGSFVMATKIKSALIPVAIDYKEKTDAFVGNDTFIPHFLKCFGKPTTEIKMTFFSPIYSDDPNFLLNTSKKMIDDELIRYRKDWDNEK